MVRTFVLLLTLSLLSGCDVLLGTYFSSASSYLEGELDLSSSIQGDKVPLFTTLEFTTAPKVLVVLIPDGSGGKIQIYQASDLHHIKSHVPANPSLSKILGTNGNTLHVGDDTFAMPEGTWSNSGMTITESNFFNLIRFFYVSGVFYTVDPFSNMNQFKTLNSWVAPFSSKSITFSAGPQPQSILAAIQPEVQGPLVKFLAKTFDGSYELFSTDITYATPDATALSKFSGNFETRDIRNIFLTRTAVVIPLNADGLTFQAFNHEGKDLGVLKLSRSDRENSVFHFEEAGTYWYQYDRVQKKLRKYRAWW